MSINEFQGFFFSEYFSGDTEVNRIEQVINLQMREWMKNGCLQDDEKWLFVGFVMEDVQWMNQTCKQRLDYDEFLKRKWYVQWMNETANKGKIMI